MSRSPVQDIGRNELHVLANPANQFIELRFTVSGVPGIQKVIAADGELYRVDMRILRQCISDSIQLIGRDPIGRRATAGGGQFSGYGNCGKAVGIENLLMRTIQPLFLGPAVADNQKARYLSI